MCSAAFTSAATRVVIAVLALAVPGAAMAQGTADRDAKEVSSYRLTDAGLAKFEKATSNLGALPPDAMGKCSDDDSSGDSTSLDQVAAKLNAHPAARSAIESAGMTTREYAVFSLAVFQAGMASWGLNQPGGKLPPGVSMDNVNFYRQHEAALNKLGQHNKADPCSDDAGDEDEGAE
jgi:hypothetical protein